MDSTQRDLEIDEFLSKTIQQNSFSDIINSEAKLSKEIKSLDLQMQQLVYDNYSHFVDASKIIRSVIPELNSIKNTIQNIQSDVKKSQTDSEKMSNAISSAKPELLSIIKKQNLMKKIDQLVSLPTTMSEHLAQQNFVVVLDLFNANLAFMNEYNNYPQVKKIHDQCLEILKECEKNIYSLLEEFYNNSFDEIKLWIKVLKSIDYNGHDVFQENILTFFSKMFESAFVLSDTESFLGICDNVSSAIIPKSSLLFDEMNTKILPILKYYSLEKVANDLQTKTCDTLINKHLSIFKEIESVFISNSDSVEGNTIIYQLNLIISELMESSYPLEIKAKIDKNLSKLCLEVLKTKFSSNFSTFIQSYLNSLSNTKDTYDSCDVFEFNLGMLISEGIFSALNNFQSCFDGFKMISNKKYGFIHLPDLFYDLSKYLSSAISDIFEQMLGLVVEFVDSQDYTKSKDFLFLIIMHSWISNFFKNSFHSFIEIANGHLSMPLQCSINISPITLPLKSIRKWLQSKFVLETSSFLFSFVKNNVSKNQNQYRERVEDVRSAFINLNKNLQDFQVLFSSIHPKARRLVKDFDVASYSLKNRLKFVFENENDTMTQVLKMFIVSIKSSILQTTLNVNGVHQLQVDLKYFEINILDIFKSSIKMNELELDDFYKILKKRCIEDKLTMLTHDEVLKIINNN